VKLLLSYILSILSGLLMMLSMPSYDIAFLAWFGFVPLFLAIREKNALHTYLLINLCTIIWSIGTHLWYPSIFGWWGYLIMIAGGLFYGAIIKMGYDMSLRIKRWYSIFALPVTFSVLEWVKTIIPFTKTWWIELLAKSQWTVPENLQLLSITGFIGLSFIIMLCNVALTEMISSLKIRKSGLLLPLTLLLVPIANSVLGAMIVNKSEQELLQHPITIGANVDLVNQDPAVTALGGQQQAGDGYLADTPQMQQKIFDINKQLSQELVQRNGAVDIIIWGKMSSLTSMIATC